MPRRPKPEFLWHVSDVMKDGGRSFNLFVHRRPKWSARRLRTAHYTLVCSIAHEKCPVDAIAGTAQHEFVKVEIDRKSKLVSMGWDRYLEFGFDERADAERFLRWCKLILKGRWVKA